MYGGIDPTLDPELAMAIRVSTEEARANEEARMKAAQEQVLHSFTAVGPFPGFILFLFPIFFPSFVVCS